MTSSRFAVAVHVLAVQALRPGEPLTSELIAGSVNTNAVVVRRLLGRLRRAGLVEVQAGAHGGSRLARPPAAIRLREVYRAVETGELVPRPRREPNPRCPVGRHIGFVLAGIFAEAERAFERTLDRTTLADVADALRQCGARGT